MYSFKDRMQENEFKQVTSTGDTHSSYQNLHEVGTSLIPIPFSLMPITFKGRTRQTTRQCEPAVLPTLFPFLLIPHCPSALNMEFCAQLRQSPSHDESLLCWAEGCSQLSSPCVESENMEENEGNPAGQNFARAITPTFSLKECRLACSKENKR